VGLSCFFNWDSYLNFGLFGTVFVCAIYGA
jgi:hypothetical protein